MKCPYCQTENRDDRDNCYYCSKDLTMLRLLVNKAKHHYNQGLEYAERGHDEEALRELLNALDTDASMVNAHLVLGSLLARQQRYEEARAAWKTALAIDHRYQRAHDYLRVSEEAQSVLPPMREQVRKAATTAGIGGLLLGAVAAGLVALAIPDGGGSESPVATTVAPAPDVTTVIEFMTPVPTPESTAEPTVEPTPEPTVEPTARPTEEPTAEPTAEPTLEPSPEPTPEPTVEPEDPMEDAPTTPSARAGPAGSMGEAVALYEAEDWAAFIEMTEDAAALAPDDASRERLEQMRARALPRWAEARFDWMNTNDYRFQINSIGEEDARQVVADYERILENLPSHMGYARGPILFYAASAHYKVGDREQAARLIRRVRDEHGGSYIVGDTMQKFVERFEDKLPAIEAAAAPE